MVDMKLLPQQVVVQVEVQQVIMFQVMVVAQEDQEIHLLLVLHKVMMVVQVQELLFQLITLMGQVVVEEEHVLQEVGLDQVQEVVVMEDLLEIRFLDQQLHLMEHLVQ